MGRGRALALGALTLMIACALLPSCQRKTQLVSLQADSTAHALDSAYVRVRSAQQSWESGASQDAAGLTAQVLAERLQSVPPEEWKDRTDALLDSLGVGCESAIASCAIAVNIFSRSDPAVGSWPYLLWCGGEQTRVQSIEGSNLHLLSAMTRGVPSGGAHPKSGHSGGDGDSEHAPGAAIVFGRRGGGGQQPLLMVWLLSNDASSWKLNQTLGPDSLGGVGSAEFEADSDTGTTLVARTYRTPRGFEECATCPHMYAIHRFHWGPAGFSRIEDRSVPSTYSTFVHFIQALVANDRGEASQWVTNSSIVDQARHFEWDRSRGAWRIAPAEDETPTRLQFLRGEAEAYRVQFEARGDDWAISGIESVPRTVE